MEKNEKTSDLRHVKAYTDDEHRSLSRLLSRSLGPEYISKRAAGGGPVSYLEGWKALDLANEVFGFNGWNSEVKNITVDYVDDKKGKISVGLSAVVRVTIKDGTFHEDVGYGSIENARTRAMAFEKCKKQAVTDAFKRCLRCFGNVLGNCLYDKEYLKQVSKVKVGPRKLDTETLYRYEEGRKGNGNVEKGELNNNKKPIFLQPKPPIKINEEPMIKKQKLNDDYLLKQVSNSNIKKDDEITASMFDDSMDMDDFDDAEEFNDLDDYEMAMLDKGPTIKSSSTPIQSDVSKVTENTSLITNDTVKSGKLNNTLNPPNVSFFSAKLATEVQSQVPLPSEKVYKPVVNDNNSTLDQSKSIPIKRTGINRKIYYPKPKT